MNEHLENYILNISDILQRFIHNPIAIKTAIISAIIIAICFGVKKYAQIDKKSLPFLGVDLAKTFATMSSVIALKIYKYTAPFFTTATPKTIDYICDVLIIIILVNIALQLIDHSLLNKAYRDTINKASRIMLWVISIILISDSHDDVISMLDTISFRVGKMSISVWDIIRDITIVLVAIIASAIINRYTNSRIIKIQTIDSNFKQILLRITRIIVFIFTVIIVLPLIGINMTAFSVLGGAVGVGIGFGLQKIASNFLSGFIILMDRSIKVGDRLIVDNNTGVITKITMRYVVMSRPDGTDLLIPNETFITNNIQNQSYSNRQLRSEVLCNISNKQDLNKALQTLQEALNKIPNTITEKSAVLINRFIDNGVEVKCLFWVESPDYISAASNDVYISLIKLFSDGLILSPQTSQKIEIISPPLKTAEATH
ncbi:MAG: mechanosensitive ion channel [Burkholderiales bacterium]|nr:mechanosensitive ion channel [Burkholderiales bacterium]